MTYHLTGRFILLTMVFAVLNINCLFSQVNDSQEYQSLEYLLLVASSEGDTAVIRETVTLGAFINTQNYADGASCLMYAVANSKFDAIELLLELGADPDITNYYGESALLMAIKDQNLIAAELLIKGSANMDIHDFNGATALHYAALFGYFYEADMLLYYSAENDIAANDGTTPLMAATMSGYYDIVDILIQSGANVNKADDIGYTPLLIAAQNGDTIILDLLLKSGANLYSKGRDNFNAAGVAARENHVETLNYLFKCGSQWGIQDASNLWDIAEKYQRKDIISVLRETNFPPSSRKGFDEVMVVASAFSTIHQSMLGFSVRLKEAKNGIGVIAGIDFKPFDTRILLEDGENSFTQYIDRRSVVSAGIFKEYRIRETPAQKDWFASFSAKLGYKYGNKYPGSLLKPEHGITFIPAASIAYESTSFNFSLSVEYMKTEVCKSGPIWLRLGFGYNYDINKVKSTGKSIKWR